MPRFECARERWRRFGLDADEADPTLVPCGHSAEQASATHRDEERIELRSLLLELEPERTLAEQCLRLIEGMYLQRARNGSPAQFAVVRAESVLPLLASALGAYVLACRSVCNRPFAAIPAAP